MTEHAAKPSGWSLLLLAPLSAGSDVALLLLRVVIGAFLV